VSVLASQTETRTDEPFLGFGNALYEHEYDGYFWGRLPATETELNAIRGRFTQNPLVFRGAEVNEARVKALSRSGELKTYSIVHFACHGYLNQKEPANTGILLSEISGQVNTGEDGNLTIEEVMLLEMNAQMVLLSACSTGVGQVKRGDGVVGLARSFMTAGAKNVGVSLWEINDYYTQVFMARLYELVKRKPEGMSFREAYYQTRNEFRKKSGRQSHPYYWAAFTMYE
jgi:CHAT domain-containing protein